VNRQVNDNRSSGHRACDILPQLQRRATRVPWTGTPAPGAMNYGSWSVGNPAHLGSALLEAMTGTQMQHVVYKETSQLYAGVATGELD